MGRPTSPQARGEARADTAGGKSPVTLERATSSPTVLLVLAVQLGEGAVLSLSTITADISEV